MARHPLAGVKMKYGIARRDAYRKLYKERGWQHMSRFHQDNNASPLQYSETQKHKWAQLPYYNEDLPDTPDRD